MKGRKNIETIDVAPRNVAIWVNVDFGDREAIIVQETFSGENDAVIIPYARIEALILALEKAKLLLGGSGA